MSFTYKSYNFVDKDPIIDEIRTIFQSSGANYAWVHEHSGVATGTITNWFDGSTKRPQAATINAVLRALGYKLGVVQFEDVEAFGLADLPAVGGKWRAMTRAEISEFKENEDAEGEGIGEEKPH